MNKIIKNDKDIRDTKVIKETYDYLIVQLNNYKKDLEKKMSNENEKVTKAKFNDIEHLKKTILNLGKYEKRNTILSIVEAHNYPIDLDEGIYQTKQDAIQVKLELLEAEKYLKALQAKKEKLEKKTARFENANFEEILNEDEDEDVVEEDEYVSTESAREQYYNSLNN